MFAAVRVSVPVEVFARAPLVPLMMPLIVVLALDLISSVEVPEANVHAPLHVTGWANSVMVRVLAAFVIIGLVIVEKIGTAHNKVFMQCWGLV